MWCKGVYNVPSSSSDTNQLNVPLSSSNTNQVECKSTVTWNAYLVSHRSIITYNLCWMHVNTSHMFATALLWVKMTKVKTEYGLNAETVYFALFIWYFWYSSSFIIVLCCKQVYDVPSSSPDTNWLKFRSTVTWNTYLVSGGSNISYNLCWMHINASHVCNYTGMSEDAQK